MALIPLLTTRQIQKLLLLLNPQSVAQNVMKGRKNMDILVIDFFDRTETKVLISIGLFLALKSLSR